MQNSNTILLQEFVQPNKSSSKKQSTKYDMYSRLLNSVKHNFHSKTTKQNGCLRRDNPSLQEFLRQRGWAPSEDALLHEATSPLIPALRWARRHAAATVAVFFAVAFIVAVVDGYRWRRGAVRCRGSERTAPSAHKEKYA
jgi:hypothetical protein